MLIGLVGRDIGSFGVLSRTLTRLLSLNDVLIVEASFLDDGVPSGPHCEAAKNELLEVPAGLSPRARLPVRLLGRDRLEEPRSESRPFGDCRFNGDNAQESVPDVWEV